MPQPSLFPSLERESEQQIFSVSEYIEQFNDQFRFQRVKIQGEIQDVRISKNIWVFFYLKDEHNESILRCFGVRTRLGNINIKDGMTVSVTGYAKLHEKYGFSIVTEKIEPLGEGTLKKSFEELKEKLKQEGIFAVERKRAIPTMPERIALIASKESAAYNDFIKVLGRRRGGIEINLLHTGVQGKEAIPGIIQAIEYVSANHKKYDIVVLTRGGGSLEDLQSFNAEEVVRAVFRCRVPIICGVGHERDETLAELAADVRASTPSNAAELASLDSTTLNFQLQKSVQYQLNHVKQLQKESKRRIVDSVMRLEYFTKNELQQCENKRRALFHSLQRELQEIAFFREKIANHVSVMQNMVQYYLEQLSSKRKNAKLLLEQANPLALLKKGYGIVRNTKTNTIITNIHRLKQNDEIETQLHNGTVSSIVKSINT